MGANSWMLLRRRSMPAACSRVCNDASNSFFHQNRTNHAQFERSETNERRGDTNQPPPHVVAQRCATPSRPPSAASATTASLSSAASSAWSQSACYPRLNGEDVLSGKHHNARKMLVNMVLWCMDLVSSAWMCVGVQWAKT